jgi:hypothetical protein
MGGFSLVSGSPTPPSGELQANSASARMTKADNRITFRTLSDAFI